MNKILYAFLIVIVALVGCSSIRPQYIAKTNQYTAPIIKDNNYLESIQLIYTYNVESLEVLYDNMFCGGVSNCSNNIDNVKNSALFGGFNLLTSPIKNNPYKIKSINLYRILYTTTGIFGESELVSGGVYYPVMPKEKIKGVILFYHPTFFAKSSVSTYDPMSRLNSSLASVFASDGYIVLYPDYIGMGYNKKQIHPYVLYPQINTIDGLYMLSAFKKVVNTANGFQLDNHDNLPLFITGYSEGSAYALWFSRLYQENKPFKDKLDKLGYKLIMIAPISGAYNLSSVTYNYLYSNNNMFNSGVYETSNSLVSGALKPSLAVLALISFAYYSESSNFLNVFNPSFFNMNCSLQFASSCEIEGEKLNLFHLLLIESQNVTFPVVNNALDMYIVNKINNSAKYKIGGDIYTIFTNSITPLVVESLATNTKLHQLLANGDIYYWQSNVPTILLTLDRDSVVSPLNTKFAYKGMHASNSTNLSIISLDNQLIKEKLLFGFPESEVDHLTGFIYLFIIVRNEFNKSMK